MDEPSIGMITRRAGCSGMGTSGSEGGQQKPASRKADRARLADPTPTSGRGFVYVAFVVDVFAQKIELRRLNNAVA